MLVLTIRTDKPESEIGLFDDDKQLAYMAWEAHRRLAETIHTKMVDLLKSQNLSFLDLQAIIAYQGPGSFTGLRIGLSVANALAYSLKIPVTGVDGEQWINAGTYGLLSGKSKKIVLPTYGAPVHVTTQKR